MDTPTLITLIFSAVALLISVAQFVLQYVLRAKIKVFVGDSVQIVHTTICNKIQLNCNFTNTRYKLGVINKIVVRVLSPNGNTYNFYWKTFYKFDGWETEMTTVPTSLAITDKGSVIQGIEFRSSETFGWIEGRYRITIHGWFVNKEMKEKKRFHISLSKGIAEKLKDTRLIDGRIPITQVSIEYP